MKIDTYYLCPVCQKSWSTQKQAVNAEISIRLLKSDGLNAKYAELGGTLMPIGEKREQQIEL